MQVDVGEEPLLTLEEYARIPSAFWVRSVFDVAEQEGGRDGFVLTERRLVAPYIKDYDAIEGEHPTAWASRFDLSGWGLFGARVDARLVGAAAVGLNFSEPDVAGGRADAAVLWDIRVATEARGRGIGAALFGAAEAWARAKGCAVLGVETQNINVAACRFYERRGCVLASINRSAYAQLPDETQLIWRKRL